MLRTGSALNGALSVSAIVNNTLASIDGNAMVEVGSALIDETDASLLVHAADTSSSYNAAGGISSSKSSAVGVAAAVNVVYRNTTAEIGDPTATSQGTGWVDSLGKIAVTAENTGIVIAGSMVVSSSSPPDNRDPKQGMSAFKEKVSAPLNKVGDGFKKVGDWVKMPGQGINFLFKVSWDGIENLPKLIGKNGKGKYKCVMDDVIKGATPKVFKKKAPEKEKTEEKKKDEEIKDAFTFSGNISANVLYENANAGIYNATILNSAALDLISESNTILGALAGSGAFSGKGEENTTEENKDKKKKKSMGISASLGANVIIGHVGTKIVGSDVTSSGDVTAESETKGVAAVLTGSLAVSTGDSGGTGAISGSLNVVVDNTSSFISGSTIDAANVSLSSTKTAVAAALAISLPLSGGEAGIGPAFAVNVVTEKIHSYITDSDVTATGDLTLSSLNKGVVANAAASGAASKGGVSIPFSLSVNVIVSSTKSFITSTDFDTPYSISAGGDVALFAENKAVVAGIAGSLGIGFKSTEKDENGKEEKKDGGAIGAAVSVNVVVSSVKSYIDGAVLSLDLTVPSVVDDTNNSIDFGSAHNLSAGDASRLY